MVTQAQTLDSKYRSVADRIRREIGLLLEYRDSLIAAVVTGRLDVREAAVPVVEAKDLSNKAATEDEDLEDVLDALD